MKITEEQAEQIDKAGKVLNALLEKLLKEADDGDKAFVSATGMLHAATMNLFFHEATQEMIECANLVQPFAIKVTNRSSLTRSAESRQN